MGAYRGFVTTESDFIAALRTLAPDPAARGLLDDAAVLEIGGAKLVLTHDMIVEGVHFLPDDPPGDIAWKLVAVNLSDLAAKGAKPLGVLLGYTLAGDDAWNEAFVAGLRQTLSAFGVALLGGARRVLAAAFFTSFLHWWWRARLEAPTESYAVGFAVAMVLPKR